MIKEDGKIYFDSKEEGLEYIKQQKNKAENDYFLALYLHVNGDYSKYLREVKKKFPSLFVNATKWYEKNKENV